MSEWLTKPLSQLASFQKGRKVETSEHPREGFAPYLGASAISGVIEEYADARFGVAAAAADVLMLWDGERSGLVGKAQNGVISSTVARLSSKGEIEGDFLYYALDAKFDWIQNRRTGTGVPHVPKDLSRILSIPFPKDKNEQRWIAEILSTLDETIEQTEALIAKCRQIKAGLMHDLFTRGVTPDGRLRSTRAQAPHLYKEAPLGWIPKEWECLAIEQLFASTACPMRSGPFGSALLKDELVEEGIPFLGIDNVFEERFVPVFRRFVSRQKFVELIRYSVFPRDVMITIMGTVGRCCVVPVSVTEALSSKHLWTMTFDVNRVFPELVCWQLNHAQWVQDWFARYSQGAVMEAIQSSTLRNLRLPVPQIKEQELILDRYRRCTCRIEMEQEHVSKLRQQKHGLMHDLLTGRVRVKVDESVSN